MSDQAVLPSDFFSVSCVALSFFPGNQARYNIFLNNRIYKQFITILYWNKKNKNLMITCFLNPGVQPNKTPGNELVIQKMLLPNALQKCLY